MVKVVYLSFFLLISGVFGQNHFPSQPNQNQWSVRFYKGYATYRPLMAIITYGDMPRERHGTGIRGIEVSQTIIRGWKGLPIDWSLRAGWIRHNEMGYQPDHNQYTLFFQGHYFRTVLGLPVTFFIGEGLSYAELVPFVEGRETYRLSNRKSNLMNYLNVGFDIKTSHIFPGMGYDYIRVGFAVSHRSGIYEQVKLFNNTKGGGNFVTLFTEYKF